MTSLAEGLQNALDYIETQLTETPDIGEIAARAYLSPFYFQRIFGALCGVTVGEYIRLRRLTLAAQELTGSEARVLDVALKYGYDSPDSFARAFQRFHGVLPSQAREPGVRLRSYLPLHIRLTLEGGHTMEFRIEEKAPFTVAGISRPFNSDTCYQEIPKFWQEWLAKGEDRPVMGTYGVCIDMDGSKEFDYLIADDYCPWKPLPEGCVTRTIPGGLWALFPTTLATLQDTNTKIWSEWLPGSREYELAGNYNLEFYTPGAYAEIWMPVKRVENR